MAAAFAPSTALTASTFSAPRACPPLLPRHAVRALPAPARRVAPAMVSETNIAAKAVKVEHVKEALESCLLMFNTPLEGLTVAQVRQLKNNLPEDTTAITVKNTLLKRAVEGTPWESASELAKQSSMWIFVESDMKGSLKIYNDYMKEIGREAPIRGGVFDRTVYDNEGLEAVSKLPTKKELIQKVAVSIKAVPTKLGRSVKAVPTKLGKSINAVPVKVARAIKLAVADEAKE